MSNSEKNALILEAMKKALGEVYPDERKVSKEFVEETFKSLLINNGLVGLHDVLFEIVVNTLVVCGLVGQDFLEDEDDDDDDEEEEVEAEAPTPAPQPIPQPVAIEQIFV